MNIGIFGGAFDPFHSEHARIIGAVKEELDLDKLVVVPSFCPPHKQTPLSPFNSRLDMVRAGTKGFDFVVIDTIERERGGINPTCEVLPILMQRHGVGKYFFIMGGDSARNFHTWINPLSIAKMCSLAVVERESAQGFEEGIEKLRKTFNADVRVLNVRGADISSSYIKATVALKRKPEGISKDVMRVIKRDKLYEETDPFVRRLKKNVSKQLFLHQTGTVLCGMKLNSQLNLDYRKVFLGCLLHDCAKETAGEMDGVPKKVVHQYLGADTAKDVYGIPDEDILNAIRYHTSGKADMTALEKLVYTADVLEENRKYDGVDRLRKLTLEDFNKGFLACVEACVDKLKREGASIYNLTLECLEFYKK